MWTALGRAMGRPCRGRAGRPLPEPAMDRDPDATPIRRSAVAAALAAAPLRRSSGASTFLPWRQFAGQGPPNLDLRLPLFRAPRLGTDRGRTGVHLDSALAESVVSSLRGTP